MCNQQTKVNNISAFDKRYPPQGCLARNAGRKRKKGEKIDRREKSKKRRIKKKRIKKENDNHPPTTDYQPKAKPEQSTTRNKQSNKQCQLGPDT